jgi:hypothetical protein
LKYYSIYNIIYTQITSIICYKKNNCKSIQIKISRIIEIKIINKKTLIIKTILLFNQVYLIINIIVLIIMMITLTIIIVIIKVSIIIIVIIKMLKLII